MASSGALPGDSFFGFLRTGTDTLRPAGAHSEPPHLGAGGGPQPPPHHEHHRLQQAERPGALRGGRQGAGEGRPALRGGGGGPAPRRGAAPRQPVHQGEPQPAQPADGGSAERRQGAAQAAGAAGHGAAAQAVALQAP